MSKSDCVPQNNTQVNGRLQTFNAGIGAYKTVK